MKRVNVTTLKCGLLYGDSLRGIPLYPIPSVTKRRPYVGGLLQLVSIIEGVLISEVSLRSGFTVSVNFGNKDVFRFVIKGSKSLV